MAEEKKETPSFNFEENIRKSILSSVEDLYFKPPPILGKKRQIADDIPAYFQKRNIEVY